MVGFNYGRFGTSYRGLYVYTKAKATSKKKKKKLPCFWEELSVGSFPLPFGAPSIPLKERGAGVGTKMSVALRVSPTHK